MFTTRQIWEDVCEGVRILKNGALSLILQSAEQASLLNYRIQLAKLDRQLQDGYRDLGERLFLRLSSQQNESGQTPDLAADEVMRQLFEIVERLEQRKKMLLEEMDELG